MSWIKNKIRKWLGINQIELDFKNNALAILAQQKGIERLFELNKDLTSIGIDVHFKSPHMILIYTKLNGGQIHHIDAHFENWKELKELIEMLKARYHTDKTWWDCPPYTRELFEHKD